MAELDRKEKSSKPPLGKNRSARYEKFRPRRYRSRMPIFWWISKRAYVHFIVRELTSLFVAGYALFMVYQLYVIRQGAEAYESLLAALNTPLSITLHSICFLVLIFHSITWFNLAPTAMTLKIGGKRIPGSLIIIVNFLMWIVLSIAIGWLILSV